MKPVHKKKNAPVKALIFAIFVLFSVVQIYPLVFLFFMSLKDNNEIFGGNIAGLPENWHWENYESAFRDGNIGLYLFNSFLLPSPPYYLRSSWRPWWRMRLQE